MKKLLFLSAATLLFSNSLTISYSALKLDYKEYQNEQVLDSETSDFTDLNGLKINLSIQNFLEANFEYNRGTSYYKGTLWDKTPISATDENVYLINSNILVKQGTGARGLSALMGMGYRYWERGKSKYEGDYYEEYRWPYYFLGFDYRLKNYQIETALQLSYQIAINPQLDIDLNQQITLNLGATYGYNIKIPFKYYLTREYGIAFEYQYDYWKINESDKVPVTTSDNKTFNIYEPESETKNQYITFGFFYNF